MKYSFLHGSNGVAFAVAMVIVAATAADLLVLEAATAPRARAEIAIEPGPASGAREADGTIASAASVEAQDKTGTTSGGTQDRSELRRARAMAWARDIVSLRKTAAATRDENHRVRLLSMAAHLADLMASHTEPVSND